MITSETFRETFLKPMATTLKDIARKLNISVSTVSYALNGGSRSVPEKVRLAVIEVAREMNYRPNRIARSMITGRNHVIGVVPPEMYDNLFLSPYLQLALNGITNEAGHLHQDLLIYTRYSETDGHAIADTILDGRVDGVIFISPHVGQTAVRRISDFGLPCVTVGGVDQEGIPSFRVDNSGGISMLVRHLLDLGHRRIAHIAGLLNMDDAIVRLQAYQNAMLQAGLPAPDEYVVKGRFDIAGGFRAMNELLDLPTPPTAVCCANDEMAIGAIQAVLARGLKVPDDMSVTGFDMTPNSEVVPPGITTVRQPITELAGEAMQAVFQMIEGKECPPSKVLPTELIVRGSTSRPKEDLS
ncbi:MAG TPA: LacI family DNA-binding transcriptional regulator [Fimbriimonadaceae bacterium]|nr:LacI family DNA-binding transcriptional regulator [Fimbriimonadaceae bacterium]